MHSTTLLCSLTALAQLSTAAYVLSDDYGNGSGFFNKFSFFTVSLVYHERLFP
jgi:hypothetical protein